MTALAATTIGTYAQTGELPRVAPETQGIPTAAINQLFDSLLALPRTNIHSVIVMRHGNIVGELYPEPFSATCQHTMYSCSKTFVSAAIGIAIGQHRLSLNDRVAVFFPEYLPDTLSENLGKMTLRDLLVMSSGITPDWEMRNHERHWIRTLLSKPVKSPGKQFEYDSMATYLLSAILQKATGQSLLDYLKKHIFGPLGVVEVEWEVSPEGINTGGWGLYIQSESLAKFGQLLLQKGRWKGQQLIPEAWVGEMMKVQYQQGTLGYGYQMWPCEYPTAFRADGALGQYILVIPEKDMVVVITENTGIDGIRQRRMVWNLLLPKVMDGATRSTKHARPLLRTDRLPTLKGNKQLPQSMRKGININLSANRYGWKSLQIRKDNSLRIDLAMTDGSSASIPLGHGRWLSASTAAYPAYSIQAQDRFKGITGPFQIAGCYATDTSGRLHFRLHYTNWVSTLDVVVDLSAKQLLVYENHAEQPYRIAIK